MNMVGVSTYLDGLTTHIFTNSTQIIVEFILNRMINQRFPVFRAKHDVEVIGYERLSHVYSNCALAGLVLYYLFVRWATAIAIRYRPFWASAFSTLMIH